MKKHILIMTTITICGLITECVYAVPNEKVVENIEIYPEESLDNEILDSGQATIKFVANYDNNNEIRDNTLFVSGVTIELYYRNGSEMVNVNTLLQFQGANFVSDENGEIVLNDVPYGLYQYVITSTPLGINATNNNVIFEMTPFDGDVYEINYLTIQQELSGNIEEEIEQPSDEIVVPPQEKEEVSVEQPPETKNEVKEEIVTNIQSIQETGEQEVVGTVEQAEVFNRFYTTAKKNFEVEENVENEIKDIPVTANIPIRLELSKKDVIREMKEVRITDAIKATTVSVDPSVYRINQLANLPEDEKKNKKLNFISKTNEKIMHKKVAQDNKMIAIQKSRIKILNNVA